jgi:D-aminoacyl-tRNA deacylase
MLAIVISLADEASVAIGEQLRAIEDWERRHDERLPDAEGGGTVDRTDGAALRTFDDRHLDLVRPVEAFDDPGSVDLLVFAAKHAGDTGPLLTAHHTGNFGPADHGGEPNALARAAPNAHATVVDALDAHAPDGYDVGMECTHHGPTDVGAPSLFVEVGSAPDQWDDPAAARAVARAILELRGLEPDRPLEGESAGCRHLVGFGGGHYAPRFERIVRETDWAVGHVAADWGLDPLGDPVSSSGRAVVRAAFEESAADVGLLADDRPALRDAIDDLGYRTVGETWVRETSGVPLDVVGEVESAFGGVETGTRFGERAVGDPDGFVVETLPEDLFAVACGVDRAETRRIVAAATVAYGTTDGGSRPTGRVALADSADRESMLDALADVLRERFDEVTREDGAIVASETAFDPAKAATLGVPEGPKFGRLAAGESVTVDGEEVPPEAVTEPRDVRFECE